jgi:amidase
VQIVAPTDGEAVLFSLAAQIERARPWPLVAPM